MVKRKKDKAGGEGKKESKGPISPRTWGGREHAPLTHRVGEALDRAIGFPKKQTKGVEEERGKKGVNQKEKGGAFFRGTHEGKGKLQTMPSNHEKASRRKGTKVNWSTRKRTRVGLQGGKRKIGGRRSA